MCDMELKHRYRLRVENCIGTIIDVHKFTGSHENESFLSQFEYLKKAVNQMDMSHVSERDVLMVEQATNNLLGEFREAYRDKTKGTISHKQVH